jgi:hypothetical protein
MHFRLVAIIAVASATAALAEPSAWKTYTYADAGFSAAFPAKPREAAQANQNPSLGRLDSKVYLVEHGGAAFVVSATTLPKKAFDRSSAAILDDARDLFVAGVKGKLVKEREIALKGHPGRDLEVAAAGQVVVARLYLVRATLYQIVAVFPKENAGGADARRFLDGFALTPAGAPSSR